MNPEPLLRVKNLNVHYPVPGGLFSKPKKVYAVNDISFTLEKGRTLGIVGESGCGKTSAGMALLNLVSPTSGEIWFKDQPIHQFAAFTSQQKMAYRKSAQIIFQDPYSSLNPRMKLSRMLTEPMAIHNVCHPSEIRDRMTYLFERVGISPELAGRYPHQLSGGQRQRAGIARALALNPELIIGDEPVSALDVSIQAQIINLLVDLQEEFGFSYIFIAHDLAVVEHISDRIAVMYLGKIVEMADSLELNRNPFHPYTRALLSAVPVPDPDAVKQRIILQGDVPSPRNPPQGCHFHPRCYEKIKICEQDTPALKETSPGHFTACHRVG